MRADLEEIALVVAHNERAALGRVGDKFVKIEADTGLRRRGLDRYGADPTPEVMWRKPFVLALAALSRRRSGTSQATYRVVAV